MDQMLHGPIQMLRKIVILTVVILLAGFAPATAVIGFCAQMPCCFDGEAQPGPALVSNTADCCSTINCAESPSRDLNASSKLKAPANTQTVFHSTIPAVQPVVNSRVVVADTSPPTTLARLVSLSTFRI